MLLPCIVSRSARALVLLLVVSAAPLLAGPPWISVEYPVNPFDQATRNALLVVHTYHHGQDMAFPLRASAEGMVDGVRRSIPLRVVATSRPATWAILGELPANGSWVIRAQLSEANENTRATVLVALASGHRLAGVRVPTEMRNGWVVPIDAKQSEVDGMLRIAQAVSNAVPPQAAADATNRSRTLAAGLLLLVPVAFYSRRRRKPPTPE